MQLHVTREECDRQGPEFWSLAGFSGLSRIGQQLRIERGCGPDDLVSSEQVAALPEEMLRKKGEEPDEQMRICQFQSTIDVSQEAEWEPLPEHKSRLLAFQSNEMPPEPFGPIVSKGRLNLLEVAGSNEKHSH